MSNREQLADVLARLPDERVGQVLDFARFLAAREERAEWERFGRTQIDRAYGADEPEYTEADVKPQATP
jgi:hypothetical protein